METILSRKCTIRTSQASCLHKGGFHLPAAALLLPNGTSKGTKSPLLPILLPAMKMQSLSRKIPEKISHRAFYPKDVQQEKSCHRRRQDKRKRQNTVTDQLQLSAADTLHAICGCQSQKKVITMDTEAVFIETMIGEISMCSPSPVTLHSSENRRIQILSVPLRTVKTLQIFPLHLYASMRLPRRPDKLQALPDCLSVLLPLLSPYL